MIRKGKGKLNTEKGQAIVEFAIIIPILLTLICGIIDFGWLYMNIYEADHATYEATRYAEMLLEEEDSEATILGNIEEVVRLNLTKFTSDTTVTIEGLHSQYATITVMNPIKMLTFVGGTFLGPWYTISRCRTFAVPSGA